MISFLPTLLIVASLVMAFCIAVMLLREFARTHEKAFFTLGIAAVVWPVLSWLMNFAVKEMLHHRPTGHPMNLGVVFLIAESIATMPYLETFVETGLMLIAVYQLCLMSSLRIQNGDAL